MFNLIFFHLRAIEIISMDSDMAIKIACTVFAAAKAALTYLLQYVVFAVNFLFECG